MNIALTPKTDLISWDRANPTTVSIEYHRSEVQAKDFGANLVVPIEGVACKIFGGSRSFFAYHSCPGMISLYYMLEGSIIHVSQSISTMRRYAASKGLKVKDIHPCKEGVAYHWSAKGLRRYVVDKLEYEMRGHIPLKKAADQLLELLIQACAPLKGRRVLTPISGGTDGILTAYALQQAGVEQHCVCIGRTEDDFDPKWAATYAAKLGLSYEMLHLPSDDEGLQRLLESGLEAFEMADFSNVLMGMCNVMMAEYAKAGGYEAVVNADLADVILGNDMLTYGSFKKKADDGKEPLSKHWADYRIERCLHVLPTNVQIFRAFEFNDVPVFQLFAARPVIKHVLGLNFDCTPYDGTKPLYYEILNRVLPENSWGETGKKVGYYTGSGIGKIRLDNPVLKDANIRETFHRVCP